LKKIFKFICLCEGKFLALQFKVLYFIQRKMTQKEQHLSDLKQIRSLMEKSTRFLSLSGLSGVFIGVFALFGAMAAYVYFDYSFYYGETQDMIYFADSQTRNQFLLFVFTDALSVLLLALSFGFYFTWRKAKRRGDKIWDNTFKRLLINLFIPLVAGGLFGLILLYHGEVAILPAITLIFYGLALVNASHYTLNDVRALGILEIFLGLIAVFFIGYGLFFWAVGFGVLHIIYGTLMYFKYERN